jgi:hypothetical protein
VGFFSRGPKKKIAADLKKKKRSIRTLAAAQTEKFPQIKQILKKVMMLRGPRLP